MNQKEMYSTKKKKAAKDKLFVFVID